MPHGLKEMVVESVRVHMHSSQHVVILKDVDRDLYLPIWIGVNEADAIARRLQGITPERPADPRPLREHARGARRRPSSRSSSPTSRTRPIARASSSSSASGRSTSTRDRRTPSPSRSASASRSSPPTPSSTAPGSPPSPTRTSGCRSSASSSTRSTTSPAADPTERDGPAGQPSPRTGSPTAPWQPSGRNQSRRRRRQKSRTARSTTRGFAPDAWPAVRGWCGMPTSTRLRPRARTLMSSSAERKAPPDSSRMPSSASRRKSLQAQSTSRTRQPEEEAQAEAVGPRVDEPDGRVGPSEPIADDDVRPVARLATAPAASTGRRPGTGGRRR